MTHPNVDLITRAYGYFSAGDMESLQSLWAQDITWHVGGATRVSRDYHGPEAILGYFGEFFAASEGTLQVELQSVFADDDSGFSLHKTTAAKGGEHYELWGVLSYAFEDGLTKEVWNFDYDQSIAEKLLA